MSTVKSKKLQVGTDATATNNFTIYQPATPDGTLRIGVGNADSPTEVAQVTSSGLSVTGDLSVTGSVPANTGPSFKATMSAVTAISNAGATKLVLNLEEWDTNSNYDSATNYRFTPTVAGYYLITGSMFMSAATTSRVGVAIYKNGSVIVNAYDYSGGIASGIVLTPAFMGHTDTSFEINFGSPPYTISSGNTDANGYGNFEYSVPSGYYALNTKNLSEFG